MQKTWTEDAINCYELNCKCEKCFLRKTLETTCIMWLTVENNLKTIGKPTEENTQKERKISDIYRKRISKYELLAEIARTNKKTAAKKFKLSLHEMSQLMRYYKISSNTIKNERAKNETC